MKERTKLRSIKKKENLEEKSRKEVIYYMMKLRTNKTQQVQSDGERKRQLQCEDMMRRKLKRVKYTIFYH